MSEIKKSKKKFQTNISEDKIFGLLSVKKKINHFFIPSYREKKRFDFIVFIHLVDFAGFAFCIFKEILLSG